MHSSEKQGLNGLLHSLIDSADSGFFPKFNSRLKVKTEDNNTCEGETLVDPKILIITHPDSKEISAVSAFLNKQSPVFSMLQCNSAQEAFFLIQNDQSIRMICFDLEMPDFQGLRLLTRIYNKHSEIKTCVMMSQPPVKSGDCVMVLDKSTPTQTTANQLVDAFGKIAAEKGHNRHFSLTEFLGLCEHGQHPILLEIITDEAGPCLCVFSNGAPIDAVFKDKKGEEALLEIIALQGPTLVNIRKIPEKKIRHRINRTFSEILLATRPADVNSENRAETDQADKEILAKGSDKSVSSTTSRSREAAVADSQLSPPSKQLNNEREDQQMALEDQLVDLKKINGFKAAAIMNFTGEILVSESIDPNINLELVGATFNDIFRTAHEASIKIGLEACSETSIKTPNGVIIMRCSGVSAAVHFHLITIMAADGNQALAKMQMDKLIPSVLAELS